MTDGFRFKMDLSEIKGLPEEIHQGLKNGVERAVQLIRRFTMEEAPKKTANLFKNIFASTEEDGTKLTGTVTVNPLTSDGKPYALFVTEGTGLYGPKRKEIVVTPRSRKALAFLYGGQLLVRKRVTIKGQKPNPFHERALSKAEPLLPNEIEKGLDSI